MQESIVWVRDSPAAFEVFARSKSTAFFDHARLLLGIDSKAEIKPLLESFVTHKRSLPHWEFDSFDPAALLGFDKIATVP